ncbi:MAG: HEAT repeat protein, partial [Planctomycetota bacterium]
DSNQEISETAAVALGILANEESIETLQLLLEDHPDGRKLVGRSEVSFRTRAFAAYGLGLIGVAAKEGDRQRIVEILVNSVTNDDTSSQDLKASAIISLGLVPLETINPETAPAEGEALVAHLSRSGQIDYLLGFLADDTNNFLVRAHVPTALARLLDGIPGVGDEAGAYEIQKDRVATVLLELFDKRTKEPREVVMGAILAMGLIGDADSDKIDQEIRSALANVPKDHSDAQARNFSLIAMAKVGSSLGSGEGADDGAAEAAEYLLDVLAKGKSTMKPWAGLSIGVMGRRLSDNSTSPFGTARLIDLQRALRSSLEDEGNPQRVGAYAIGTGIMGDLDSNSILLDKLDELRDEEARGYVAVALGLAHHSPAIENIKKIVTESEYRPDLLKQAAIALGLLGDNELVDDLVTMLGDATNLATQAAISSALGFIGDSRSITPLVEMLADDTLTESARGFAAVALGIVADKEPLPWNSKIAVDLNYRASTSTLTQASAGTGILDIL